MVRNNNLRARFRAVRAVLEAESRDYVTKAAVGGLYKKQSHDAVGGVSGAEMVGVYTLRMVPKKATGRPIYDRIMSLPTNGRCPMCGIGTVNTLDHYLPKESFPIFSVTPLNLVPACKWCQGEKHEYFATSEGEQLLHPYFDNFDHVIWLGSEVVVGSPPGFRFFASPPNQWTAAKKARFAAHLEELNLKALFSSNAGSRLSEIRYRLAGLLPKGGGKAVRAHLHEELLSIEADHRNSWVAAMYRAAVASDWFCDGGFSRT